MVSIRCNHGWGRAAPSHHLRSIRTFRNRSCDACLRQVRLGPAIAPAGTHNWHTYHSYHVPSHIQEHIDYITPGVKLLAPTKRGHERRQKQKRSSLIKSPQGHGASVGVKKNQLEDESRHLPASLKNCDTTITPACVRALYGIPKHPEYPHGKPRADNSLGIFEFGDYYAQEDLDLFFANYSRNIPQGTHPIHAFIDGAEAPVNVSSAGGESALDFELAYPLIYPQTTTLYQSDDVYFATNPNSGTSGGFNTFLDAIDGSYCTYSAFGETGNARKLPPARQVTNSLINPLSGSRSCVPKHSRLRWI